jgi:hypothetical protein
MAVLKSAAFLRIGAAAVLAALAFVSVGRVLSSNLRDALAMPGGLLGTAGGVVGCYDLPSGAWAGVCLAGNLLYRILVGSDLGTGA